ncbi:protein trichome birefringence-like 5 isoform X1 [Populus alba x Populus x berolinensis]|nr:protein trichome birefringence-like 5 isoform X1 [Populus alba x Populus x berolinensis]
MANSSSFNNRYAVITSIFLASFLFTVFLFNKRALEPSLSFYRDFFPQTATAPLTSSPNFTLPDSEQPVDSAAHQPVSRNETIESKTGDNSTKVEVSAENEKDNPDGDFESGGGSSDKSTNVEVSSENEKDLDENLESGADLDRNGDDKLMASLKSCDLYMGTWVKDEEYPIYEAGSCPYVDEAFDCQGNGRKDSDYLKWRWKPYDCDLPRFNATDFLTRLRGKRLMLVGDSMNRNQFESMLCLLREGLPDKSKMFEIHGNKITKGRGYYVFKFVVLGQDYECTVEFVRSHFLVKEGVRINAQGSSNPTLSIDVIDKTAGRWKRADILVFNTGHWWTHGKTARGKNYYKEGDYLYPKFDAVEAYRRALKTWAKWIDQNVDPKKQLVFYRGYSSAHFRGGDWDSGGTCNGETEPVLSGAILNNYPVKMKIVEEVIQEMKNPVTLLNVTRLTNFRKDGHPSIFGKNATAGIKVSTRRQDCSHWCVPGVPDAWNELIYATLLQQTVSKS